MKNLQRLCAAVVLTLTLSLPISAGVMDCGVAPPPPPPAPTQSDATATARGEIDTGPGVTTQEGSLSHVVWGVVEGVLALL